jgi:hypothetical protein
LNQSKLDPVNAHPPTVTAARLKAVYVTGSGDKICL